MQYDREKLFALLVENSYEKREVKLASGRMSNFYFDAKQTTLHAEGGLLTGQAFYLAIRDNFPEAKAVGGLTMGADPIATAASLIAALDGELLHAFLVRKEPKKHGKSLWIEGNKNLPDKTPVVIVEDVGTTGASALKAVDRAREEGLNVVGIVVLVDREEGAAEAIAAAGLKLISLFKRTEFETD